MFFRKPKKEENKPIKKEKERLNNAVFGSLVFVDFFWKGHIKNSLFGEEEDINLYVYVDEEEKIIEEEQEKAYLNYIQSQKEIDEAIRNVIIKEFELSNDFDLRSRFRLYSIIVTVNGSCGIAINDNSLDADNSHYTFVVDTEPGHELTETEEYYLYTK